MSKKISQFHYIAPLELNDVEVPCIVKDDSEKYTNKKIKIVDYFVTKTDFDNKIDKSIDNNKVIVSDNDGKIIASDYISVTELNALDGIKKNIQDQLDNLSSTKLDKNLGATNANKLLVTDSSGNIVTSLNVNIKDSIYDKVLITNPSGAVELTTNITTADLEALDGINVNIKDKFDLVDDNLDAKLNKNLGVADRYLHTDSYGNVALFTSSDLGLTNLMKLPNYDGAFSISNWTANTNYDKIEYTAPYNGTIILHFDLSDTSVKCYVNYNFITIINGGVDKYQNLELTLKKGDILTVVKNTGSRIWVQESSFIPFY